MTTQYYTYILSSYFLIIICYHHSHIINVTNVVGKPKAMTPKSPFPLWVGFQPSPKGGIPTLFLCITV